MAKIKRTKAGRMLVTLMVAALLFAAFGNVFICASAAGEYGKTVYLKTTDSTDPYIYYWDESNNSNSASWPGVKMEKMSGETDVYFYDLPCDVGSLTGIIFNNGANGDKMTGDLTSITGNMYTLSGGNGSWGMYDTSDVKITSYGSDLQSPQYTNSSVRLFIEAESSNGDVQCKISVSGAKDEVLMDWSSSNSVVWNPTVAGDYTVLFEAKDGSGATNSRQADFTIKDADNAEDPVFLSASPANNAQIQKGGKTTVKVNGAGGKINTNLLFYKTEVIDPDGNPVNTVYYKLDNRLEFNADKLGAYTVKMTIQNSSEKNTTTTQTYTYNSVNEVNTDTEETDSDVRVTGVTLDKKTATLKVEENITLKATVNPSDAANKSVTWSSSNEKVAKVDNGTVTAISEGTATIEVKTADGGYTAECAVTVTKDDVSDTDTGTESDTDTSTDTDTVTDTDTGTDTNTDTETDTDTESDTDTSTDTDTDNFILGDVDGDGEVTMKDASRVQQFTLQLCKFTKAQEKAADVDGDGQVTLKDASLIQRYTLDLINF